MTDSELLELYLEQQCKFTNEESMQPVRDHFIKLFNQTDHKELDSLTPTDFITFFSHLNIIEQSTFDTYKSKTKKFFIWLSENNSLLTKQVYYIESITFKDVYNPELEFNTYYYRDFDDLLSVMSTAFGEYESEFDTFRCAAILVWYGINKKYLPNILKKDLLEDEYCIISPVNNEKIYMNPYAVRILVKYRDAISYDSSKFGGVVLSYKKSEYLFRTYKNEHLSEKSLINCASSATKTAENIGKGFKWDAIYMSGVYYRIYQYEIEHGMLKKNDYDILNHFFPQKQPLNSSRKQTLRNKYKGYLKFKSIVLI